MKEIAKIELPPTELVRHGSWGSRDVGKHPSTMTLYCEPRCHYEIEWDIPGLDEVEHIGLTFEDRVLVDYDGIMALPHEAIAFLRAQGFTVPKEFE